MSSYHEIKKCPRCGTPIEPLEFGDQRHDVCYACGWGEQREEKVEGLIAPYQLVLYWVMTFVLLIGSYYGFFEMFRASFAAGDIGVVELTIGHIFFWGIYAGLGSIVEVEVDSESLTWFGGLFTDPLSLLSLLVAGLLFPGRIVWSTFYDTLDYLFYQEKRQQ